MAKYSKAASKKVEQSVKEMKKGTLKTGSGKKVTDKKQAVAIGLSEARSEGKKVPKKATSATKKNSATSTKKTAPKKSAAKKSNSDASKATTNSKKTNTNKSSATTKKSATKKSAGSPKKAAPAKKAVAKKGTATTKKSTPKKSAGSTKKDTTTKPSAAKKSPAKKPAGNKQPSNIYKEPKVQDPVIKKNDVPVEEKQTDPAMLAFTEPNPIPRKKYAVAKDTYHNHTPPTSAKTSKKPSGKKPLWNSGN